MALLRGLAPLLAAWAVLGFYGGGNCATREYILLDPEQEPCMVISLNATFEVSYSKNENDTGEVNITLPVDANVSGNCLNDTDQGQLRVEFGLNRDLFFSMNFTSNFSSTEAESSDIAWNLTWVEMHINTSDPLFNDSSTDLDVSLDAEVFDIASANKNGYKCSQEQMLVLNMTDGGNTTKNSTDSASIVMTFSDLSINLFNASEFTDCVPAPTPSPAPSSSRIVPIAVGAALAALIILVLISYIINTRMNKKKGYEQVEQ